MKLLIVEDDRATIQTYEDNIESFNKTSAVKIIPFIHENLTSAKSSLTSPDFDAAIIDLKLSSNTTDLEGLEIVHQIEQNLRFPIFIVSGSIGQIEKEESAFLKKRSRDGNFKEILGEISGIYDTGITKILGYKGDIDKHLSSIFWNHLSNSMDVWINDTSRSPEEKQKTLLRYTLLHIQEHLELSEASGFEDYHPAEIYITPPVKQNVFTGDIVKDKRDDLNYIVLTPACDLAHDGKTENVLLVLIEDNTQSDIAKYLVILKGTDTSGKKEAKNKLKKLIDNSSSNKYHFLPKYKNLKGGLINFQNIKSVSKTELNDNFDRLASINSSFTKDIVARFSYYYSRQGSPDFNTDEILQSLIND